MNYQPIIDQLSQRLQNLITQQLAVNDVHAPTHKTLDFEIDHLLTAVLALEKLSKGSNHAEQSTD
jgi:hypothetical protein